MKINRIQINNIGAISDADIPIDRGLTIFFGDVKQGKTTILNAIRWVCGGSYPKDIIKHGEEEGFIHIFFDDGSTIRREFYTSRVGGVKDRPIQYIKNGIVQSRPVEKLKNLLNPFQLNQNYFTEMSAVEKTRYLIDLFECSTDEEQKELAEIKKRGSDLVKQADKLKPIKLIEKVEKVDTEKLEKDLEEAEAFNKEQKQLSETIKRDEDILSDLDKQIQALQLKKEAIEEDMGTYPEEAPLINTSDLIDRLSDAKLINYKHEQYLEQKSHNESVDKERAELKKQASEARKEYKEKLSSVRSKLSKLNKSHGIKGLVFNEDGSFTYENTSADMLSTSQQAKLSSSLQAKYPDSFGIELIDQGESWGSSIYTLIDKAKKENKTILTTVVGEAPAIEEDHVGVFVVEKGEVKK